jgi:hypothetical protein
MFEYLRKFILVFAALALFAVAPVAAQHGSSGRYSNVFTTYAYEEVGSTTGVVKAITPGIINTSGLEKTLRAYVSFSGQGVRWTADGATTPTTDLGIPVAAGGSIELIGNDDIVNFEFINDDGSGSTRRR